MGKGKDLQHLVTLTLARSPSNSLNWPDHSQDTAKAVLKVLVASHPYKEWKGRWSLLLPAESQSAKINTFAQGIQTAGHETIGFVPNSPAALPCTSSHTLFFPSKESRLRWFHFSCRHTGRALPSRTVWNSLSAWTQKPLDQLWTSGIVKYSQPGLLERLLDLQFMFSREFIYHLSSQLPFFSPSKWFSCSDNSRSWGFKERQPNLRRLSTQMLTFGSSTPSPTAEMLTAAQDMLK